MAGVRITEVDREHFDSRTLDLYWCFLAERQAIWLRRSRGITQPWTGDPILQVEFITNVYRMLDPGTEYLIESILGHRTMDPEQVDGEPTSYSPASDEAKVFNIMLYRLMGSVPSTHMHLGFQDPDNFSAEAMVSKLAELPDDYRIFGDAYRVASYMAEGSDRKVENVANMFGYIAGGIEETVRRIKSSRRVVEVYKVFETMQGFGEFLSHQIVVDLLYPNAEGAKIVPFTDDEFAKAGPGARKGIWSLLDDQYKPANLTIVLEWLRDNQQDEFDRLGINFPYLAGDDSEPRLMSICDIQASLCEFYKYYRLWTGDKAVQVRKYDGPHREVTQRPVHMTEEEMAAVLEGVETPHTFQDSILDAEDAEEAISGAAGRSLSEEEDDEPREGSDRVGFDLVDLSDGPVQTRTESGVDGTVVDAVLDGGASSLTLNINLTINIKR